MRHIFKVFLLAITLAVCQAGLIPTNSLVKAETKAACPGFLQGDTAVPCWSLNGKCYCFSKTKRVIWTDADKFCRGGGMTLLNLESKDEDQMINSHIKSTQELTDDYYWISGRFSNNRWEWATNEPLTYTHWYPGEPSHNQIGSFTYINYGFTSGIWFDEIGPSYILFICESITDATTSTSATTTDNNSQSSSSTTTPDTTTTTPITTTAVTTTPRTTTEPENLEPTTSVDDVTAEETTEKEVPTETTTGKEVPTEKTTEKEVPTETTTGKEVPTETTTEKEVPTETTTQKEVPTETTAGKEVSTEATTEELPTETTTGKEVSTEATTEKVSTEATTEVPTQPTTMEASTTSFPPSTSTTQKSTTISESTTTESTTPQTSPTPTTCPNYLQGNTNVPCWTLTNGKCYCFSKITRNWTGADSFCRGGGMNLLKVETAHENNLIYNHYTNTPGISKEIYWTSGRYSQEGKARWEWATTTPYQQLVYKNWYPFNPVQPDFNQPGYCMDISFVASGYWFDVLCTTSMKFICESK